MFSFFSSLSALSSLRIGDGLILSMEGADKQADNKRETASSQLILGLLSISQRLPNNLILDGRCLVSSLATSERKTDSSNADETIYLKSTRIIQQFVDKDAINHFRSVFNYLPANMPFQSRDEGRSLLKFQHHKRRWFTCRNNLSCNGLVQVSNQSTSEPLKWEPI